MQVDREFFIAIVHVGHCGLLCINYCNCKASQHKAKDQLWLQGVMPIANDQLFHLYTSILYIHHVVSLAQAFCLPCTCCEQGPRFCIVDETSKPLKGKKGTRPLKGGRAKAGSVLQHSKSLNEDRCVNQFGRTFDNNCQASTRRRRDSGPATLLGRQSLLLCSPAKLRRRFQGSWTLSFSLMHPPLRDSSLFS